MESGAGGDHVPQVRIGQVSLSAVTVEKLTDCIRQEQMNMQ